jgi:ABC-2 type transport system ATP-binding protein
VVFLDEMTTGLDPAARRVAWDLIQQIRARGTTVVLVTHFMDEAEVLCDRLAIIDKGLVVAMDSPRDLITHYAEDLRVIFTTAAADVSWLNAIELVDKVERIGPCVTVYGKGAVLAYVAASLMEHGIAPPDLRVEQPSLEDVFLKLTGHSEGLD